MTFNIGNYVSRNSHNNDIIFKIVEIENNVVFLKGVDYRLFADSSVDDLKLEKECNNNIYDKDIMQRSIKDLNIDRSNFFYLPGRILHIDGDPEYLNRCMKFYDGVGVKDNGFNINEDLISKKIYSLLVEYKPDILVITGHDAYNKSSNDKNNINNYQNSLNFYNAVIEARKYEKNQDKLIIIAGACQSDYEDLIKAGANFSSSPKRINLHALDPAIVASSVALSEKNKNLDVVKLIEKTKYGKDGIGGIITNGTMYVGYPR